MAHGPVKVRDFIKEIKEGNYVIPHFQRDYDWNAGMVADLFKSILHDYYAGTILLWILEDSERERPMWDPLWSAPKNERPVKAVLDGQQRLTSLYYAIVAPNEIFPSRTSFYSFYINLDNYISGNEEESVVYQYHAKQRQKEHFLNNKHYIKKSLFPLTWLENEQFMNGIHVQQWIEEYVEERKKKFPSQNLSVLGLHNKLSSVMSYEFLTETLEGKSVREICSIFANINSKGMRLSIFDLLNAFLYPHGISIRKDWENHDNEQLKEVDDEMKVQVMKLISLHQQKYCSSNYLYNLIPGSKIKDRQGSIKTIVKDKVDFENYWKKSLKYAEKARKKIMSSGKFDFGAIKPIFIPSTTILTVLGALIWKYDEELKEQINNTEFQDRIERWYWCAALTQDYSGSSDSIMAKDYSELVQWLQNGNVIPERVKKVTAIFIEESIDFRKAFNANNSQYSAVLNFLALKGAKDFLSGRILGNFDLAEIHDHHLFPKKSGIKISDNRLFDCILNRTLIVDETNRKITNKKPSKYYKEIVSKISDQKELRKIFDSHFINKQAEEAFRNDDFENFIKFREREIINHIKKLLGLDQVVQREIIQPGKDYDNEQIYIAYIAEALNYLYIIDPYFNRNALSLLRKGLRNIKKIKEIKIISRSNNIDNDFKNDFKKLRKQLRSESINLSLRILNSKYSHQLHDRYLIHSSGSFNFISADTASRGQLSHVKEVDDMKPTFDGFWNNSIDLFEAKRNLHRISS